MKHSREFVEILLTLVPVDGSMETLVNRLVIGAIPVSDDAPITRVVIDREEKKCERNLVT